MLGGLLSFYPQCYLREITQVTVCIQPCLCVISKQTIRWLWVMFTLSGGAVVPHIDWMKISLCCSHILTGNMMDILNLFVWFPLLLMESFQVYFFINLEDRGVLVALVWLCNHNFMVNMCSFSPTVLYIYIYTLYILFIYSVYCIYVYTIKKLPSILPMIYCMNLKQPITM